jgi:hypothetical protein
VRRLRGYVRTLLDRFRPAPIPEGWTEEAFAEIRPRWDEPLTGEIPVVDTGEVIELKADELGLWAPSLAQPARAWLFDTVRELHPVDLHWRPAWAEA